MYRFVFFLCLVSLAACLPRRTGRIVGGTDVIIKLENMKFFAEISFIKLVRGRAVST